MKILNNQTKSDEKEIKSIKLDHNPFIAFVRLGQIPLEEDLIYSFLLDLNTYLLSLFQVVVTISSCM